MDWIHFLITFGIICIVILAVVKGVQVMGLAIHPIVWIIGSAIIGIVLLIWLGKVLPAIL